MVERDQQVFKLIHTVYKIPIAILLGGGYCVRKHIHNNHVDTSYIISCVCVFACVCVCVCVRACVRACVCVCVI